PLEQGDGVRACLVLGTQGGHALRHALAGIGQHGLQGNGQRVVHGGGSGGCRAATGVAHVSVSLRRVCRSGECVGQANWAATIAGGGGAFSDKVSTSTPVSVMTMVCSHCAERLRSLVTIVHPSGSSEIAALPALIIGSMVKIIPGLSSGPVPALP